MSEEKTKTRVRKTLTEQIAEKEERIKALRAEAARLKRRASAKERKARTHLLIKYGAELFNALQINIDDLLKKENSEQVIRQQIEKQVILHTIGNEILQKTGISAADLIADPRVNAQFFRFLQQADQLLFAHFPKNADTGNDANICLSYAPWSHWWILFKKNEASFPKDGLKRWNQFHNNVNNESK